jgi:hypothetical protein
MKRLAPLLAVFASLLLARSASAGDASSFWIEARPWTCSQHVAPVARELSLACDAAGAKCSVAANEAAADHRIVIRCDETKWTVEAEDKRGARLWAVDVTGELSDRARSAAVFAVRAETGEHLPAASAPAPSPPPRAPVSIKIDERAPASTDTTTDTVPKEVPDVTLVFASRGNLKLGDVADRWGSKVTENGGKLLGVSGAATIDIEGLRIGPTAGLGIGVDYSPRVYADKSAPFYWTVGAVTAIGAPFKRKVLGLGLEGGFGRLVLDKDVHDFGYVRPSIIVQPLPRSPARPFLAAAYEVKGGGITGHHVGLDLGMAWDL